MLTWNKTEQEMFLVYRAVAVFTLATQHYVFTVRWNHFLKRTNGGFSKLKVKRLFYLE